MNHSRAFWKVRNLYAEQMRGLWTRVYTGEGLWGRGALLSTGEFERNTAGADEPLPEHLCGGTYRSRSRKRKASNKKKTLTYQEQKQRRILKKFGANGVTLGEDPITKRKLEKGKSVTGKPRVAGSARGRELRAAAALARFDQQKEKAQESEDLEGSDTDSGEEEDDTDVGPIAVDVHGNKLLDSKGRDMVKVCEDENPDGQDAQDELAELQRFSLASWLSSGSTGAGKQVKDEPGASAQQSTKPPDAKPIPSASKTAKPLLPTSTPHPTHETKPPPPPPPPPTSPTLSSLPRQLTPTHACPLCTFLNEPTATTCAMCANTLALPGAKGEDMLSLEGTWACQSRICAGARQGAAAAGYRNAADCGVCGVCGERRT